ncbi:gamma-aminobutyric acid receptor subunit delta [Nephila pilipes]|uniref:Gamma-aminobutyric acid receptor subunit delta n=1 Tax=Nephila pilipes TaxID=299642 RepID=A0A8X6TSA2_NEPPI|nr:gamma-aminobutyric acid receptor subunit delta [Nephila pilipes]
MLILELLMYEIVIIAAKVCEENVFPPDYNKQASPGVVGNPAHLYIDLNVMDIDRIDEARMEFSIQGYFREVWKDSRLNLSCLAYNNFDSDTSVPERITDRLWTPDIVFDNARSGVLFSLSVPNRYIAFLKSGTIFRSSRYNLVVGCYMNFMFYPMDVQECFLKISLLTTPDHILLIHWASDDSLYKNYFKGVTFAHDMQTLKYDLLPPRTYTTKQVWFKVNFTYLYANFTFVRKISGSLLNVYIPSTLVVFLSWTSFWIDVEAVPARITLGVTSLLTLVTQMIQARNNLPAISYMTAIDLWLFSCLLLVFCSILAYTFTYRKHTVNKKSEVTIFFINCFPFAWKTINSPGASYGEYDGCEAVSILQWQCTRQHDAQRVDAHCRGGRRYTSYCVVLSSRLPREGS